MPSNVSILSVLSPTNNTTEINKAPQSPVFGLAIEVVFLWIICGNIIIITVLKLYKPLTIPDILVFSLALADLLNVLFPAQVLNLIQSHVIKAHWTEPLCIAFTWSTYALRMSSVLTISVISVDRFIAIRKPLYYRSRVMHEIGWVKVVILLLWLFSCLVASLPYMGFGHRGYENKQCHYQLLDLGLGYGIFVEIIGLLQLVLVLYCYIAIKISTGHFMKRQDKFARVQLDRQISSQATMKRQPSETGLSKPSQLNGATRDQTGEQNGRMSFLLKRLGTKRRESSTPMLTEGMRHVAKMEKMMAALVFLFYISWLPFLVSNLISLILGKASKPDDTSTKIVGIFSLVNGLMNPVVYATIYPRYKKGYVFVFRTIFRICGGRKSNITTADFDSSKVGRLRRLQTLKAMKSSSATSSTSTMSEYFPSSNFKNDRPLATERIPEEVFEEETHERSMKLSSGPVNRLYFTEPNEAADESQGKPKKLSCESVSANKPEGDRLELEAVRVKTVEVVGDNLSMGIVFEGDNCKGESGDKLSNNVRLGPVNADTPAKNVPCSYVDDSVKMGVPAYVNSCYIDDTITTGISASSQESLNNENTPGKDSEVNSPAIKRTMDNNTVNSGNMISMHHNVVESRVRNIFDSEISAAGLPVVNGYSKTLGDRKNDIRKTSNGTNHSGIHNDSLSEL